MSPGVARPSLHSRMPTPNMIACTTSNIIACARPVHAPRSQATIDVVPHLRATSANSASSRSSAAKVLTVALPVTESASVPLMRESHSRAARLAGLT